MYAIYNDEYLSVHFVQEPDIVVRIKLGNPFIAKCDCQPKKSLDIWCEHIIAALLKISKEVK